MKNKLISKLFCNELIYNLKYTKRLCRVCFTKADIFSPIVWKFYLGCFFFNFISNWHSMIQIFFYFILCYSTPSPINFSLYLNKISKFIIVLLTAYFKHTQVWLVSTCMCSYLPFTTWVFIKPGFHRMLQWSQQLGVVCSREGCCV